MPYSEFRSYSPMSDCDLIRISMCDARGSEYFVLVKADDGKRYRERRDEALTMIETAIRQGLEPGEVREA